MTTELEIIANSLKLEFNQIRKRRVNDLYVNSINGDDSFPGSYLKPFKTIQKAIDVAGINNPIIHLASGNYNENLNIHTSNISIESLGFKDSFIIGQVVIPPSVTNLFFKNLNISHGVTNEPTVKDTGSFGRIKFDNVSIIHTTYGKVFEANNSQNEISFNNCIIRGSFILSGTQVNEVKVDLNNTSIDGSIHIDNDKHILNIRNSKYIRTVFHDNGKLILNNIDSIKNSLKIVVSGTIGTNILQLIGSPNFITVGPKLIGNNIPTGTTITNYDTILKEFTISQPLTQNIFLQTIEMDTGYALQSSSNTGYLEIKNCSFKNSDWGNYGKLFKNGNCDYRFINLDRRLQDDIILNGTNLGQGVNAKDINSNLDDITVADLFILERTKRLIRVYNPTGYISEEKLVTVFSFNQDIPGVRLPTSINDEIEGMVINGGLFIGSTGYILRKGTFVSTLNATGYNIGDPIYGTLNGDITLTPTLKQIGILLSNGPNATIYINLDGFISNQKGIKYGIPYLDINTKIPSEFLPDISFDIPAGTVSFWHQDIFDNIPILPPFWAKLNGQLYLNPASLLNGKTLPNINGDPNGADTFNNGKIPVFIRAGLISGIYQNDENKAHTHNAIIPELDTTTDVVENAGDYGTGVPIFTAINMALSDSGGIEARPKNTSMIAILKTY